MASGEVVLIDGVAAIIRNAEGKVLVGKRKGSHGAGSWGVPGGHLEEGETELQTAERETMEETGLAVRAVKEVACTVDDFGEDKCYRTHFVYCEAAGPNPVAEVKEPNKCETWAWKSWDELKELQAKSAPDEVVFRPLHGLLGVRPDLDDLLSGRR